MTPMKTVTIQAGDLVNEKRKIIPEARRNDKTSIKSFHENAEKISLLKTPCILLRTPYPLSILCLRILGLIIRMHIMDMDSGGR